ncbi:MAG: site-specific DNA-methyltransferase [Acidobacteriia bacterium]|nr:site-specific DNA-methyltransferase [Terriglobia bacterium]
MAKINITKTELIWPGKYSEDGTLKEVPRVSLPLQVIETVNESRATREAAKRNVQHTLFDIYSGEEGDTFEAGWRNKLIWGDNLLVMGSLLEKFAGKIDLIYIDPPFATGADFSFKTAIGDLNEELVKEQSVIEEKAYRDTWARGTESFAQMIYERLILIRELLSETGSVYVHIGPNINHLVRILCDEIFGEDHALNEVVWRRAFGHSDSRRYGMIHDAILYYSKGDNCIWNELRQPAEKEYIDRFFDQFDDERGERYQRLSLSAGGLSGGGYDYEYKGIRTNWRCPVETLEKHDREGRLHWPKKKGGVPRLKKYESEHEGVPLQDIWIDISKIHNQSGELTGYATQKPEGLLERILRVSSNKGDLVADFFCGSGTTLAVAEKLGRRWIGCDLGRWGIHVTRKRLLAIENCNPFEVLNLGKYERQYWQGVTFNEERSKSLTEQALYEYLAFILKLYGAQPLVGLAHLHGKKGKAVVHIGAVDAPVTITEIDAAVAECRKLKLGELHVLGWEWEMGLYDLMVEATKKQSVELRLLQIPREAMEQQAAVKGDVRFFELAYLEAEIEHVESLTVQVTLKHFVIPNSELIPKDVRGKVQKWSDYIDYWAVDWDFHNDTFMQGWVTYRTRKNRKLALASDLRVYSGPGKYRILIKVIDIFGNDTSQAFEVEVS